MLYLPRELHDWYVQRRLDKAVPMYDLFKSVLYQHAKDNGFEHACRFKFTKIYGNVLRCVVCGVDKE